MMVRYNRGPKKGVSRGTSSRKVGYGMPPMEHRFAKGKSGNPSGRPKSAKTLGSFLAAELGNRVTINEGRGPRRISKMQAMIKQIVNNAVRGDHRCTKVIMDLYLNLGPETDPAAEAAAREKSRESFKALVRLLDEATARKIMSAENPMIKKD